MATPVAFVDCETTGLDSRRHEMWELAIITADHIKDIGIMNARESTWGFDPNAIGGTGLAGAEPMALQIGKFHERTSAPGWVWDDPLIAAPEIAHILHGRHLIGAVPDFDARFLTNFLHRHRQAATWHYHLIDVENLVAGAFRLRPPWNSEDLSRVAGVDPDQFPRHTALGDARWAKALYEIVLA